MAFQNACTSLILQASRNEPFGYRTRFLRGDVFVILRSFPVLQASHTEPFGYRTRSLRGMIFFILRSFPIFALSVCCHSIYCGRRSTLSGVCTRYQPGSHKRKVNTVVFCSCFSAPPSSSDVCCLAFHREKRSAVLFPRRPSRQPCIPTT